MTLAVGEAFLCPEDWEGGRHLWILISDPRSEYVLIVNVSSINGNPCDDRTCELEPGDHRFIRARSCIRYDRCRQVPAAQLDRALATDGRFIRQPPVSNEILIEIREGSSRAPMIEPEHRSFMRKQGLAP